MTSLLIGALIIFVFGAAKPLLPVFLREDSRGSLNEAAEAVLWEANNPYYESMTLLSLWERRPWNPWTRWKVSPTEQSRYETYFERGKHQSTQSAWLWIRENPGAYSRLVFIRLWTTLGPFTGMMSPRNRFISSCTWLLIFPAGFYGWWLTRRRQISQMAAALTVTITLFSALVIVEWYLRYRFPIELFLMAFAGIGYSHGIAGRLFVRYRKPITLVQ
jgi:hypothetical protein